MRIMLDPGHSGTIEPGACAHGLKEADIVLSVARLLRDKLTGHEVMLTRDDDVDDDYLSWRAELANDWGADIFISLHCNAFADPAAHGAECWIAKNHSDDSERLAYCILNRLVNQMDLADRGVKQQNFTVLTATDCPAVLVELAFITNPAEAGMLLNMQEEFAQAIADGIEEGTQCVGEI